MATSLTSLEYSLVLGGPHKKDSSLLLTFLSSLWWGDIRPGFSSGWNPLGKGQQIPSTIYAEIVPTHSHL